MRRDKDDKEWQQAKDAVDKRDSKRCRCCQILTPVEYQLTKKLKYPSYMFTQIDHAHLVAAGVDVTKIYDVDNIYCLCRFHHSHLDGLLNPVNDERMTTNEQNYWWWRIKNKSTATYDETLNYGEKLEEKQEKRKTTLCNWW